MAPTYRLLRDLPVPMKQKRALFRAARRSAEAARMSAKAEQRARNDADWQRELAKDAVAAGEAAVKIAVGERNQWHATAQHWYERCLKLEEEAVVRGMALDALSKASCEHRLPLNPSFNDDPLYYTRWALQEAEMEYANRTLGIEAKLKRKFV